MPHGPISLIPEGLRASEPLPGAVVRYHYVGCFPLQLLPYPEDRRARAPNRLKLVELWDLQVRPGVEAELEAAAEDPATPVVLVAEDALRSAFDRTPRWPAVLESRRVALPDGESIGCSTRCALTGERPPTSWRMDLRANLGGGATRISCVAYARIAVRRRGTSRILLGRPTRRQGGSRLPLSLPGGALRVLPPGTESLNAMGIHPGDRGDLRLRVPAASRSPFLDWFARRQGRELTPWRELREELVEEWGVLGPPRWTSHGGECGRTREIR